MSLPPITFQPLPAWTDARTSSPKSGGAFRISWDDARTQLRYEADQLGADLVVIQLMVPEGTLRADRTGFLRGGSDRVSYRGAVVSLNTRQGPLRMACDQYWNPWYGGLKDWQMNVRAITLTLEALRGINRWGAASRAEQYTGWLQLPAAATPLPGPSPLEVLYELADLPEHERQPDPGREELRKAYRAAARRVHPDAGGSRADWDRLRNAAKDLGID